MGLLRYLVLLAETQGVSILTGSVPRLDNLFRFTHKLCSIGLRIPDARSPSPCSSPQLFATLKSAETQGFEPWRAFKPYLVSSEALSTTQPRLHDMLRISYQETAECSTSRPPSDKT